MHDPVPAPGPSPLILSLIEHPFHRSGRTVRRLDWTPAVTLASLIGRFVPRGMRVRVYLNGEHVPAEHLHETFPMPGDAIAVAPELGDEDKGILRAILMIATAAISMWAAPWLMGFTMFWGNALLTSMLAGSLMLIGGLVVNSLLPPLPRASTPRTTPWAAEPTPGRPTTPNSRASPSPPGSAETASTEISSTASSIPHQTSSTSTW